MNEELIRDAEYISDWPGKEYEEKCYTDNYTRSFKNYKMKIEKELNISLNNQEDYNRPFSMGELDTAISKSSDSSPGTEYFLITSGKLASTNHTGPSPQLF